MTFLRSYGLSLICGAMICGILSGMIRDGMFQKQIKLLCSLFLTLTVVKPLVHLELPDLDSLLEPFSQEAETASMDGAGMLQNALAQSIQQETEAYIRSKAELLQASLQVQVHLSNGELPIPDGVILAGTTAPEVKEALQEMMENELNIPKEQQQWIGQH